QARKRGDHLAVSARFKRVRRALEVGRVARRSGARRVLAELNVVGHREATREGAKRFRSALEELGTTYIKLGQLLSSRPDLLPDVYIEELGRLVDEVPAEDYAAIKDVIDQDVGADIFVRIDPNPLATASIAQTHAAVLGSGRDVVVKVRRPGVAEQVALDLAVLRSSARFAMRRSDTAQLLQLDALADELEIHLRAELNFVEEAHNTGLIGRMLERFDSLVVPAVHPSLSERVLILDRIEGTKVSRDHTLPPDRAAELAREFFRAYVYQVVVEGVYHADPHHGNILLTPDRRLALIDFGLLGRLDDDTRRTLALLLLALAQNRADDVAELIFSLSLTSVDSDEAGFIHDLRRKLPRYHWRPLSGIRTGEALADLQRLALTHNIRLPTSFALVGKTLAQADAIARTLHPELDPVELIERETIDLLTHEASRRLTPDRFFADLYTQIDPLTKMPRRIAHLTDQLEHGGLKIGVIPTGLGELEHNLRSIANRIGAAIIISALLLGSSLIFLSHRTEWLAISGFALAGLLATYMIWRIARTPGEL
ncbi:MAG TPA: AarF/UbiB family protein, partial [Acidimicrobiales bacterium]|nr:AarF/UbiB family protein [Acidimicrobiales bacterium]